MSGEFGFANDLKLNEWDSGVKRASRKLDKGDAQGALYEARCVVDSYLAHRRGTDIWGKTVLVIVAVFIVIAVILGLSSGEWGIAIVIGVIGLVIGGTLQTKIVDKRVAVDNEFYGSYRHLMDAIEDLSKRQ